VTPSRVQISTGLIPFRKPSGKNCVPIPAFAQACDARFAPPPPSFQHQANPYTGDPQRAEEGRVLLNQTCVVCHGAGGPGGRGPNLRESKLVGLPFLRVVWEGRKGTQMAAWKGRLSEEERWEIRTCLGR
jgi:mono/diheme cytochrome c family protein